MDTRQDHKFEDPDDEDLGADAPPMLTEAELLAFIERNGSNKPIGPTLPVEEVLAELRATAERIRERKSKRSA